MNPHQDAHQLALTFDRQEKLRLLHAARFPQPAGRRRIRSFAPLYRLLEQIELATGNDGCELTVEVLAAKIHMQPSRTREWIKTAEQLGVLSVTRNKQRTGGQYANIHRINWWRISTLSKAPLQPTAATIPAAAGTHTLNRPANDDRSPANDHRRAANDHRSPANDDRWPQDLSLDLSSLNLTKPQIQRQPPPARSSTKPLNKPPTGGPWGRPLTPADLKTAETLRAELFPQAVALGWFLNTEDELFAFVAIACAALRKAESNPGGYFTRLAQNHATKSITHSDEEQARKLLKPTNTLTETKPDTTPRKPEAPYPYDYFEPRPKRKPADLANSNDATRSNVEGQRSNANPT